MTEEQDAVGPDETTGYELWDRDTGNLIMDWEAKDRADVLAFIADEVDGLSPEEAEPRADSWQLLRFFGMTSYEIVAEGAAVLKLRELKRGRHEERDRVLPQTVSVPDSLHACPRCGEDPCNAAGPDSRPSDFEFYKHEHQSNANRGSLCLSCIYEIVK